MIPDFDQIVFNQRQFFLSGGTSSLTYRLDALKKLKKEISAAEKALCEALHLDLGKSEQEAYLTEIGIVYREINKHLEHLENWMTPKRAPSPFYLWPSRYEIRPQPLGVSLILSPWNYPVQLLLNPLIGAISAGCCAVLKPSPKTPQVNLVLQRIIHKCFPDSYVTIVLGDESIYEPLLKVRFDFIFFTGSTRVGKIILKSAAEHLCPVVLELGGKNPCFVHQDADLKKAAKRIVWGKCLNAGQTCIAPDYLLVHESVVEQTLTALKRAYLEMHEEEHRSPLAHFGKIIDQTAHERLSGFLEQGSVYFQGKQKNETNHFPLTILRVKDYNQPLMQEEIFGPILPVMTYSNLDEEVRLINSKERPLAAYFFGSTKAANYFKENILAGGLGINETVLQIANDHVPFGGVGQSGTGAYHGKHSFDAFSHFQTVITTPTWIDLPFRYPPFKYFQVIRAFLK